MKRPVLDAGLSLLVSCLFLFLLIVTRLPFFYIFIIGCALFLGGLIIALFFNKQTMGRRWSLIISYIGGFSALIIWLLVRFLISRLQ